MIGLTILLFGIALIVLPGPAFIVIPLGLGILATEFYWARKWHLELKRRGVSFINFVLGKFNDWNKL